MSLLFLGLLLLPGGESPPGSGDSWRSLEVGQRTRRYLVHVPRSYDGKHPFPVVLAFHGGASSARQMPFISGLSEKADEAGFIVVYPDGTGWTWNAGNCCGYAASRQVDDVAFTRALLDDLATAVRLDPRRVFATGLSNGALFSYRLASELSDRIAAIAPVAGPMGTETCRPRRAVSVIHFHGTDDEFAPVKGGRGPRGITQTDFYSVDYTLEQWIKANRCPAHPTTRLIQDRAHDGTTATIRTYGPGKEGAEVVLVLIEKGGHTWPGRRPPLALLGKSTRNVSANDLMWDFFQKHSMK